LSFDTGTIKTYVGLFPTSNPKMRHFTNRKVIQKCAQREKRFIVMGKIFFSTSAPSNAKAPKEVQKSLGGSILGSFWW
jgi:hypothetical protein